MGPEVTASGVVTRDDGIMLAADRKKPPPPSYSTGNKTFKNYLPLPIDTPENLAARV